MKTQKLAGIALAAAAASLFATGLVGAAEESGGVKVKCYGANACKGHGACKTAMNACKGKNACQGKGFEMLTEQACVERLGRA